MELTTTKPKTKKEIKTPTILDRLKTEGCFHCGSKKLEPMEAPEKTIVCLDCGCEHTDYSYEYGIPVGMFDKHKVAVEKWNKKE